MYQTKIYQCRVLSVDAVNRLVYVLTPANQATGIPCKLLHQGPCDALRIHAPPMPTPGSYGLVAWVHGLSTNGIYLGSLITTLQSAVGVPTDANAHYEAHP